MINNQLLYNCVLKQNYSPQQRSAEGWMVIVGFVLFTAVCYFAGAVSMMRLIFPVTAFLTGAFLYLRHPILYIGFTWWIWFVTPLLTRLVDLRVGYDSTRQMMIASYLVSVVSYGTLARLLPVSIRQGALPFILSIVGVLYGLGVGFINNAPVPAIRSTLDWLTPVAFGFHLYMNWRDYPSYRQNFQRIFFWGVLITGIYAIYQFTVAPEWDNYWLIQSKMYTSSGKPEPFGMRVWSTMHSFAPFGAMLQASLLLLFTNPPNPLSLPAAAVGYLSLLLTQARTSWAGWVIGMVLMFGKLKPQHQIRFILIIFVMLLCVLPLATVEPFNEVIVQRMETLTNLEKDNSFQVRSEIYNHNLNLALSTVNGNGLGNIWRLNEQGVLEVVIIDSGILDMFFTLGWFGAIPYLGGMILIVISFSQSPEIKSDRFIAASQSIGLSFIPTLIFGSGMLGFTGMIFWSFLAMSLAGQKYYQHQ